MDLHPVARYFRIGFSAMCLMACALMVVLWVRSYWRLDRVRLGKNAIASSEGLLLLNDVFNINATQPGLIGTLEKQNFANNYVELWSVHRDALIPVGVGKSIPCWPIVAVTATLAGLPWLPWIRWRFSLRTLLIAITLVSVLLGLVVWAVG